MSIHVRLPQFARAILVWLACTRSSARREMRRTTPTGCRLIQLAIVGLLVLADRLVFVYPFRLLAWPYRRVSSVRTTAHIVYNTFAVLLLLAFVGLLGAYFIYMPIKEGITAPFVGLFFMAIFLGVMATVIYVLVKALRFTAWALASAARHCPIRLSGIEETITKQLS